MSVSAGLGKLKRAAKDLRAAWNEVRGDWQDENSRHFEETYVAPLLARARTAELTMAQMASVVQQAHQDCE